MSTEIVNFEFHTIPVRVVKRGNSEEYIAKDVCRALDIPRTNDAVEKLDSDEKARVTIVEPDPTDSRIGGIPRTYVTVTEAGLYKLVFLSSKPKAKEFVRWLTHEVLPKIRRTGFYVQDGDEERVRNVLDRILRHKAANWELMWKEELPKALAPVYGLHLGSRQFPVWMSGIIGKIYNTLFGEDVVDEARSRRGPHTGKGNLLHQFLTEDARQYLRDNLTSVLAFARASQSPDEFWRLIEVATGQRMMQLRLFTEQCQCPSCGFVAGNGARFCAQCGARVTT